MTNGIAEIVGKRLRDARKERQLTQARVAHELGIDLRHYQRIEAGKANVTLKTLERISAYFREEPWRLLHETACPLANGGPRPRELLKGKTVSCLTDLEPHFPSWDDASYGIACLQPDGHVYFANRLCDGLPSLRLFAERELPTESVLIIKRNGDDRDHFDMITWESLAAPGGPIFGFLLVSAPMPCRFETT